MNTTRSNLLSIKGADITRRTPVALLFSDDQELTSLVRQIVRHPWKLVRQSPVGATVKSGFVQTNVRLVTLDDQAVAEPDRAWFLAEIHRHFFGAPLLYVAGTHSSTIEQRARASGAHYYVAKPVPVERFSAVMQSFLRALQNR